MKHLRLSTIIFILLAAFLVSTPARADIVSQQVGRSNYTWDNCLDANGNPTVTVQDAIAFSAAYDSMAEFNRNSITERQRSTLDEIFDSMPHNKILKELNAAISRRVPLKEIEALQQSYHEALEKMYGKS